MTNKIALVTGCNGQLGSYMTELLETKGYRVYGIDKDSVIEKWSSCLESFRPDEIYNFAGYSNTFNPYANIDEMIKTNLTLPQLILHAINEVNPKIKFFQASSALIFGLNYGPQNEHSPLNPLHPYGFVKAATDQLVRVHRENNGLFACSGILFPTESPRRGKDFFTKKVCTAVANIKLGNQKHVTLGNLTAKRDWSYAPQVCKAIYTILQNEEPKDYVIGSGAVHTTEEFVSAAFECVGLNYKDHIIRDFDSIRKTDMNNIWADNSKIRHELGWEPKYTMKDIAKIMVYDEINLLKSQK